MKAFDIEESIREKLRNDIKVYPSQNIRASNLGHACERYLYLLIKRWEDQRPHDIGLQSIFDLGNALEEYTINKLKAAGWEVFTPSGKNFQVNKPLITGREDIRIKDTDTNELIPAEIKGLNQYDWEKLNSIADFYESPRSTIRGYPAQLMTYMWRFEKERGFFVLTNKASGQIKVIDVPFDWDYVDGLFKKADRVYVALADESGNTLPAPTEDMEVCKRCNLSHVCTAPQKAIEAEYDDGELAELIEAKETLREFTNEYDLIDKKIKAIVGDREKVISGAYLITTKIVNKAEYVQKAISYRRINIARL